MSRTTEETALLPVSVQPMAEETETETAKKGKKKRLLACSFWCCALLLLVLFVFAFIFVFVFIFSSVSAQASTKGRWEEPNQSKQQQQQLLLQGDTSSPLYKRVRYFGFQIYTGGAPAFVDHPKHGRIRNKECFDFNFNFNSTVQQEALGQTLGEVPTDDGSTTIQCYVGKTDPVKDARERLRVMRDAVEAAYNEYTSIADSSSEPDVLKIFAAPEFYFRGITGAYAFAKDEEEEVGDENENENDPSVLDKIFGFNQQTNNNNNNNNELCDPNESPVCAVLEGLQEIVEDVRFKDWVFLFGTVVATQKIKASAPNASAHVHDDNYEYLYYNFAPVYKGFDPDTNNNNNNNIIDKHHRALGKRFLVNKRYVSTSDFLTPSRDVQDRGSDWQELFGPDANTAITANNAANNAANANTDDDQGDWVVEFGSAPKTNTNTADADQQTSAIDNPRTYEHKRYNDDWFAAYKQQLYDTAGYVQVEYDWLIVDGITFSIEVCLDHQLRTALDTFTGDLVTGRTVRIPSAGPNTLDFVKIPTHQAHIGLVSSAGMSPNPESLALGQNGILFLQDGISNLTSRRFVDDELKQTCGNGLQFEGGTVAVRRRALVSNTDVRFEYELLHGTNSNNVAQCLVHQTSSNNNNNEESACEHRVPVYPGIDWRKNISGIFSTRVYEPHLLLYGPLEIPDLE